MEKLVSIDQTGKKILVRVQKEHLLADDNENFKHELEKALSLSGNEVILDLEKVSYVSSLILASMMYIVKEMHDAKKKLALTGIQPKVEEMLQITGLDKILEIK